MQNLNYYAVEAKCGHIGKGQYILITFPIKAFCAKDAAYKARYMPRVKHDHKDAIRSVKEITYETYQEIVQINNDDQYLKCKSRHEQNAIDIENRIVDEEWKEMKKALKKEEKEKRKKKKELAKKLKKEEKKRYKFKHSI